MEQLLRPPSTLAGPWWADFGPRPFDQERRLRKVKRALEKIESAKSALRVRSFALSKATGFQATTWTE